MRNARGFTVVEVLIACAIVALGLLAIGTMFPSAYGNMDKSGKQTTEVTLAQQRIESLRNQDYTAAALAAGTTTENLGNGYTRTTTIDANPIPGINGIKQVRVQVTSDSLGGGGVTLTTLIAQ